MRFPIGPQRQWCCFQTYNTSVASVLLMNTWLRECAFWQSRWQTIL